MKSASTKIPASLAPYFQEYDFEMLDLESDAGLIIGRTLEHGSRKELRWLFKTYEKEQIKKFLREHGSRALCRRIESTCASPGCMRAFIFEPDSSAKSSYYLDCLDYYDGSHDDFWWTGIRFSAGRKNRNRQSPSIFK